MSLRLDNCVHCACVTPLVYSRVESAIRDLECGEIGCWNCSDQEEIDRTNRHTNCVQLLDSEGKVLWDGRCRKEERSQ